MIPLLALLTSAACFAGETYVEPAPMPAPAPAPSLWTWFAGGSVGFMDELEDEYWSIHAGVEKQSGCFSHAFFVEVGWTGDSQETYYYGIDIEGGINDRVKLSADLVPITLNYKFEAPLFGSQSWHWYAGGGIGALYGDISYRLDRQFPGGSYDFVESASSSDWVFFGQISAGVVWNLTESFEIFGGGRWLYFDDLSVGSEGLDSSDDLMGEIGIRFNF